MDARRFREFVRRFRTACMDLLRRHRKACIAAGVPLLLVTVLLALTVRFQTGFPRPELSDEDWKCQSRVVMKVMQQVLKKDSPELARITLSPKEVDVLLRFAVNADQLAAMFGRGRSGREPAQWLASYDEHGKFRFAFIAGVGPARFILRGSSACRYGGNRFVLSPENCRVGLLPVPAWMIRPFLPKILAEVDKNSYVQLFHQAVETIEVDPEKRLIVTYRPAVARTQLPGVF